MGFTDAIRTCFGKYVTFSGRATRREYWYFVLFMMLGVIVAGLLDGLIFGVEIQASAGSYSAETEGYVTGIFALATVAPFLAVGWRRMHDTGRSGLHLLYPLIVIAGITGFFGTTYGFAPIAQGDLPQAGGLMAFLFGASIIVLFMSPLIVTYWLARPSEPRANAYGPSPHEAQP